MSLCVWREEEVRCCCCGRSGGEGFFCCCIIAVVMGFFVFCILYVVEIGGAGFDMVFSLSISAFVLWRGECVHSFGIAFALHGH